MSNGVSPSPKGGGGGAGSALPSKSASEPTVSMLEVYYVAAV